MRRGLNGKSKTYPRSPHLAHMSAKHNFENASRIHRSLSSLAAVVMRPLSMRRACALVILVCIARHSLSIVIGIQQRDLDEGLLVLGDL